MEDTMLKFLYETEVGRMILKPLIYPTITELSGRVLDSEISRCIIPAFIKKNHIKMSDYEKVEYKTFNQFFYRNIKAGKRPIRQEENVLISPCDGLLSAYRINKDTVIPVKQSRYRISDLLRDKELAEKYEDGICLVFRLCVNHYHRYCFPVNGRRDPYRHIPGVFHTVRPIALRNTPVFIENDREYTTLHSDHFGDLIQMEVGAMLVGKIVNDAPGYECKKGMEKGHFEYGGSTVILLLEKDKVKITDRIFEMTKKSIEVPVKMGQLIGWGCRNKQ